MSPIRHRRRPTNAGTPTHTLEGVSDRLSPSQREDLRWAEQAKLFIVYLAVSELTLPNRHARRHSKKQIRQIAAAITEFGFINPVVIDKDGRVVCGIARVLAALLLGIKEIPTIRVEYLTEAQKRAYAIADNRLAELASWDQASLAALFKEIEELEAGFNLEIMAFDTSEIDRLVEALDKEPSSPEDEVPDLPSEEDAVTQLGDQFALDQHRLICGDARDRSVLQRLLGNELAQMVFTDPPWNLRSSAVGGLGRIQHRDFAMAAGEMSEADFIAFLIAVLANMAEVSVDGAIHFVCMDWRHAFELQTAGRRVYTRLKNLCVWCKDNAGMGSFYRSQHELVFAFKYGTAPNINNFMLGQTGRYRSNIWSYAGLNTFRAGRMEELAMHPTVKPVVLVADAIRDCSKRGGIILDAFGGSGTTLIAAEKTHRRARLVELDRLYCDVIVQRWQKLTGKAAATSRPVSPSRSSPGSGEDPPKAQSPEARRRVMSDTYEVGYGKPPRDGQFQPGQSGNPRGRPRGSKNMLTEIRDELSRPITTPDGKKVSKPTALTRSLVAQGLKGNMQALKLLLLNVIPEVQALTVQEREEESVRGARVLQEMILETFKPLEDEKDREREGAETPELPH